VAIAFRRVGGTRGGVLLVHGFTGTPHEVEGLADPLAAAGYNVLGVRLPGHGASEPGETNDWPAWQEAVDEGFAELGEIDRGSRRAVIGLSMGALLALDLARRNPATLSALVALSPAVTLPPPVRALLWFAARALGERGRQRLLPRGLSDIRDPQVRASHPKSQPFAVAAALSFNQLRLAVRARVGAVEQPLLIIHSLLDRTCPVSGARWLARNVGSSDVELCILEKSGHVIPVDVERDRATERILVFLDRALAIQPALAPVPVEAVQAAVHVAAADD